MKKAIKSICNFIVTIILVILVSYIIFFTDLPTKTGNTIRLKVEEYKSKYTDYNNDFKINDLSINMDTYYYDKLTYEQQKIYSSIANATKNFESEFAIRDYIAGDKDEFAKEVAEAISAFINDHPEAFYLESQYSSYVISGLKGNIGYIRLNYTEDSVEAINEKLEKIQNKIEEYTSNLEGLSDYEKELTIHDRLANGVEYSDLEDLPRAYHTVEGTLIENIGVCDGFTKSLQLLYDRVGIDSIIVLGTLDQNPHAWNMVKLDDEWYHVDITSSRSIIDETGIVNHAYFNLTDENIKKFSTIDSPELLPQANSFKYNFYAYNNYEIKEDQDITQRLNEIYNAGFNDKNYIEFYLYGNVSEKIAQVLVAMKNIDNNFMNGSKMFYYNVQNAIIIPKN